MAALRRSFAWLSLLLSLCVAGCSRSATQELAVGDPLPVFSVRMQDGSTVRSQDLRGTPSIIVFFHVGCRDCQRELPEIQKLYDMDLGIPIVLIARENNEEDIRVFWEREGLTLPYSPQPDRKVYSLFAESRIPRIYISDSSGIICFIHTDEMMPDAMLLAEEIASLS